jgi:3-hydroxy acid dehydrogenase/malonic semialdehyde reductase
MDFKGKRVLVTGATAGIGEATTAGFVRLGAHVIAVGRRAERLNGLVDGWNALAKKSNSGGTAEALVLDVTDHDAVTALAGTEAVDVDILIGNAGLARGKGPVQIGAYADWKEMVDTNILGLLDMFKICYPALERRRGHVVNLGSVAGRWTYPGGNVYSATKFAVRALSESMRIDVQGTGIRVTNIAPGAVDTEFSVVRYHGDETKAAKVYEGYEPLHAEDIAETILWSCSRPAHVNIQELVVYPTAQASVRDIVLDEE